MKSIIHHLKNGKFMSLDGSVSVHMNNDAAEENDVPITFSISNELGIQLLIRQVDSSSKF